LLLVIFFYVTWQSYDVARREIDVSTARATEALNDQQFDRAMRYALHAYPARGRLPWMTPFSTELEGLDQQIGAVNVIRILLRLEQGLVVVAGDRSGYIVGVKAHSSPRRVRTPESQPRACGAKRPLDPILIDFAVPPQVHEHRTPGKRGRALAARQAG
jgi:hypothetical protein